VVPDPKLSADIKRQYRQAIIDYLEKLGTKKPEAETIRLK
jgi:hypothetical protein